MIFLHDFKPEFHTLSNEMLIKVCKVCLLLPSRSEEHQVLQTVSINVAMLPPCDFL